MSTPNMTAIAREAGVGKATVSLALRNDPRLKLETRHRIQAVADRMGYRANAVVSHLMAQLRASRNPKFQATIGILNASHARDSLQINNTFHAWTSGLRDHCSELGYGTDDFWLYEPGVGPERLRQILLARNIRGVVIAAVLDQRQLPPEFDILWQDFACVVVGIRPERPALHFACNDQFSTAMHTAWELDRLGYRRPGLVIDPVIEENIDHRFTAGFYAGRPLGELKTRIPVFDFDPGGQALFASWMQKFHPDVIVCTHPEVRGWLADLGLQCPRDIGLAHLDLTPELDGWSGMHQNNEAVGAFAADLVIGQLHRNETGIPDRPKCMMIESQWVGGSTLRSPPVSKHPDRPGTKRKARRG
jgi:LacI family transcriptional regulator